MHKMLYGKGHAVWEPPATYPDKVQDFEELTRVEEGGRKDKTNHEPKEEKQAEGHDVVAKEWSSVELDFRNREGSG